MKISKLFHWLYAVVMLLPVFAIGVTCGYAMFNKNAYQSYGDNYVEKFTEVNSTSMFVENNIFKVNYDSSTGNNATFTINDTNFYDYFNTNNRTITTITFINESYARMNLTYSNGDTQRVDNWNNYTKSFTFTLKSTSYNLSANITHVKLYLITYQTRSVSDVFYYSVDKVTQSNLFNWAYDSFLVAPFSYIVSLFSMPSNSPVVMLMSYWLAISIIWLVFDLVMYVPLLVHRWLDKGAIE